MGGSRFSSRLTQLIDACTSILAGPNKSHKRRERVNKFSTLLVSKLWSLLYIAFYSFVVFSYF